MDYLLMEKLIREIYMKMIQVNQKDTEIEFTDEEIDFIKRLEWNLKGNEEYLN